MKNPTNAKYAVKPSVKARTWSRTPESTRASNPSHVTYAEEPSSARWTCAGTRRPSTRNCAPWGPPFPPPEERRRRPTRPPRPRTTMDITDLRVPWLWNNRFRLMGWVWCRIWGPLVWVVNNVVVDFFLFFSNLGRHSFFLSMWFFHGVKFLIILILIFNAVMYKNLITIFCT